MTVEASEEPDKVNDHTLHVIPHFRFPHFPCNVVFAPIMLNYAHLLSALLTLHIDGWGRIKGAVQFVFKINWSDSDCKLCSWYCLCTPVAIAWPLLLR